MVVTDLRRVREALDYFGVPKAMHPLGLAILEKAEADFKDNMDQAQALIAGMRAALPKMGSIYKPLSSTSSPAFDPAAIRLSFRVLKTAAGMFKFGESGGHSAHLPPSLEIALKVVGGAEGLLLEFVTLGGGHAQEVRVRLAWGK